MPQILIMQICLSEQLKKKNLHYYDNGYKAAAAPQTKQPPVKESTASRDTDKILVPVNPVNEKTMVVCPCSKGYGK